MPDIGAARQVQHRLDESEQRFRLLCDDHPLTTRYRRDLTRALF